jgi:hypothetical protein
MILGITSYSLQIVLLILWMIMFGLKKIKIVCLCTSIVLWLITALTIAYCIIKPRVISACVLAPFLVIASVFVV